LQAVVKLPSGTFKPYTGVSTAILFFQKTSSGGTDHVWFYDVRADGFTLDDKRTPTEANDLPDVLARWKSLGDTDTPELAQPRTAQSFLVPKAEIVAQGYDLSLNRYREVEHEHVEHRDPADILADLAALEIEIQDATAALAAALGSRGA
jgi:type I restriction enzyme M protein